MQYSWLLWFNWNGGYYTCSVPEELSVPMMMAITRGVDLRVWCVHTNEQTDSWTYSAEQSKLIVPQFNLNSRIISPDANVVVQESHKNARDRTSACTIISEWKSHLAGQQQQQRKVTAVRNLCYYTYYSGKGKSSEQLNFIAIAKCFHVIGHMLDVWMSLCAPSWYLENLLAWNIIIIGVCGGWSGTALPGSLYS